MKRKLLPFVVIAGSLAAVYACSSSSSDAPATNTNPEAGTLPDTSTGNPDTSTGTDSSTDPDSPPVSKTNPIEGIAAPKQVADAFGFVDGPQWFKDTLYVSRPFDHLLLKVKFSDGTVDMVRTGDGVTEGTIGNSLDKSGNLISAELKKITRTPADGGALSTIATTYSDNDGGVFPFDTPNDLVQHPSGTIIFTDPGYEDPMVATNHLIRVLPDGGAFLLEDFPDAPRPNGIALSKDGATLYVSVTSPAVGTKPFVRKYTVGVNGALSNPQVFASFPHPTVDPSGVGATNDEPDGIAVDDNGNVFVAWRLGVNVYKSDGTRYGAEPSIALAPPNSPNNVAFGRADRRSLFITTGSGKIYETIVNIPGLLQ
jgi:gluconolactonase